MLLSERRLGKQTWPVLDSGYCRCPRRSLCPDVRPSGPPCVTSFVCAITHHSFKLGSLNVYQRCKRPFLRSLFFCRWDYIDLKGQIELKNSNLTPFWACLHHAFILGSLHFDRRFTSHWLRFILFWVQIWLIPGLSTRETIYWPCWDI